MRYCSSSTSHFASLDPLGVEALSAVIADLARDGTAVLFSSHRLDLVEHVCQDVTAIDQGRVVPAGELERLRAAPAGGRSPGRRTRRPAGSLVGTAAGGLSASPGSPRRRG
jgi:ABC-2 type transport system ATP-binding protein